MNNINHLFPIDAAKSKADEEVITIEDSPDGKCVFLKPSESIIQSYISTASPNHQQPIQMVTNNQGNIH